MDLTLGNPAGLLALLGLPAVLAIHLLQRRARRVEASTLFLLPPRAAPSIRGRRFERLRRSLLLALELAAVLVATWLLVDPRWIRPVGFRRIVVVIDESASMGAFQPRLAPALAPRLAALERTAERIEWVVLGSNPRERPLYDGPDRDEALRAAVAHPALRPHHDLGPSVDEALTAAGTTGSVLLVTDHETGTPPSVERIAVGEPLDNVGFAGASVEPDGEDGPARYRAVVRSASRVRAARRWWVEVDGTRLGSDGAELALDPDGLASIEGRFPGGLERLELVLDADGFPLDDRLPLVRPRPKRLRLHVDAALAEDREVDHLRLLVAPWDEAPFSGADLAISPLGAAPPPAAGALLLEPAEPGDRYRTGAIVAARHPLVDDLSWQGFLATEAREPGAAPRPETADRTLVMQGARPLLALRRGDRGDHLVVAFPLRGSNAARLPAFLLAVHRYAEAVREAVVAPESRNLETGEPFGVALGRNGPPPRLVSPVGDSPLPPEGGWSAPERPGFFEVRQGETVLLRAGAHFADAREGDLRRASAGNAGREAHEPVSVGRASASASDPLASLWLLGLLTLALCCFRLEDAQP